MPAVPPPPASTPSDDIVVQVFGRTDVGRTRDHNEDAFLVADLSADVAAVPTEVRRTISGQKGSLFVVADGMGGAAAGEIASAMAVEAILGELRTTWIAGDTNDPESFVRAIKVATKAANEKIHSYATAHPEYRGMGTTATIAGLLGDTLYLAQVGDPATGLPIGATRSNLKAAIAGETHEYTDMYPGMAKAARGEGFEEIADWFETLAKAERSHANRFTKALGEIGG